MDNKAKAALELAIKFFKSKQDNYGPGIDLLISIKQYMDTNIVDDLNEYGALVTHCLTGKNVPIETFNFD